MSSRSRLALFAFAAVVLGMHYWVLSRLGRVEAPPAPATAAAVPALDLLATAPAMPAPAVEPPAAAVPAPVAPPRTRAPAPRPMPTPAGTATPLKVNASAADLATTEAPIRAEPLAVAAADASPPAGVVEAAAAAPAPIPAPPVYKTRVPPAATVDYRLSRGGISGSGSLSWQPTAQGYTLKLEGRVPVVGSLITQTSRGGFDAAGLAPLRFTDKRLRRSEQAANFQRNGDGSGEVTFSGSTAALALHPGVQDRVSVFVQLAAIAEAWSHPPAVGEALVVQVVGARADAARWSFRYEGIEVVRTVDGETVQALRFQRAPDLPHDTRAEFWLDPGQHHMPMRVRLSDGNSEPFELLRRAAPQ